MKKPTTKTLNYFSNFFDSFPCVKTLSPEKADMILESFHDPSVLETVKNCILLDNVDAHDRWMKTNDTIITESVSENLRISYFEQHHNKPYTEEEQAIYDKLIREQERAEKAYNAIKETEPKTIPTTMEYCRKYLLFNCYHVTATTVIPCEAWKKAFFIRSLLYAENDLGKYGKQAEVLDRLEIKEMDGKQYTVWSEFSAHKAGKKDIIDKAEGINLEKKTGCGDWLYSKRSATLEQVRREYERKVNDRIRWDYMKKIVKPASKTKKEKTVVIDIHYEKTWTDFFHVLEGYSGSIDTFFKPVKVTENGYVFQLQEISTSEKKIAYLMQFNDK